MQHNAVGKCYYCHELINKNDWYSIELSMTKAYFCGAKCMRFWIKWLNAIASHNQNIIPTNI